jgi:hypothetical protein
MKITKIKIHFEPNDGETKEPFCLIRNENKIWEITIGPDNIQQKGLYPSQITIASEFQETIRKISDKGLLRD